MKLVVLLSLFVVTWAGLPHADYHRYAGYKVFSVRPRNDDQARLLRSWMLHDNDLDFWQEASHGGEAHVMVSPTSMPRFLAAVRKNGMRATVLIDSVQEQVESFMTSLRHRVAKRRFVFDINDFNTFDDTINWVRNDVVAMCAASGLSCTTASEGTTHEGRDIVSITMGSGGAGKQTFIINSLIHAREWIAGATVNNIIQHMATGYGSDQEVTSLLDSYDFLFIPVLNPDGYEYSWTNERLWRKNRYPFERCYGVDLNRNYDYNWGLEGVSHNECSDLYCGPSGNSELETQALDSVFARITGAGTLGYLDVHSYGYMWMHPWGNTVNHQGGVCERADDHDEMYRVADRAADAIQETFNTDTWLRGTSCEVIYETTGATDDYIKGVYGATYPICPELRGNSFIIDADQIQPSFEEIWNGLVEMVAAIEDQPVAQQ